MSEVGAKEERGEIGRFTSLPKTGGEERRNKGLKGWHK